MTVASM